MATKTWIGTTADVTTAGNWSPSGQPTAGDDVIITGTQAIDGATLSSAGNLASFTIRDYSGTIGSTTSDLVVDIAAAGGVTIDTTGQAYLDFNASDTDVTVYGTATVNSPNHGLWIKHTSLNDMHVYGGSVRIASGTLDGNLYSYASAVRTRVDSGAGVVDYKGPGSSDIYGTATDIYAESQKVRYYGTSALTVAQAEGGASLEYYSDQNITTANAWGGTIDGSVNNESITVTNTSVRNGGQINVGGSWTVTNAPTEAYSFINQ